MCPVEWIQTQGNTFLLSTFFVNLLIILLIFLEQADCYAYIYKTEGLKGLFRGATLTLGDLVVI
jgi:hypothetical protein